MAAASRPPNRSRSLRGPGECRRDGHLLVEREPDQQRERLAGDQCVGVGIAGEMQCIRHGFDPRRDWTAFNG